MSKNFLTGGVKRYTQTLLLHFSISISRFFKVGMYLPPHTLPWLHPHWVVPSFLQGGITHIVVCMGTCHFTSYHFQFESRMRYQFWPIFHSSGLLCCSFHFLRCPGSTSGSIFVTFTPKRPCRLLALCECDFNRLNGNISTFPNRFLTNFHGRAQFFRKKLKDTRVLFKSVSLQDGL